MSTFEILYGHSFHYKMYGAVTVTDAIYLGYFIAISGAPRANTYTDRGTSFINNIIMQGIARIFRIKHV